MDNIFAFLTEKPYNCRMVARSKYQWGFISTAFISDGVQQLETAVRHSGYTRKSDGATDELCIVEAYDTREQAEAGHKRWVETMTTNPPKTLTDCANAQIHQFGKKYGVAHPDSFTFVRVDNS